MELFFYGVTAFVSLLGGIIILSRSGAYHGRVIAFGLLCIALLEICYILFYVREYAPALRAASVFELFIISAFTVSIITMEKGILRNTRRVTWLRRSLIAICLLYAAALFVYPVEYAFINLDGTVILGWLGKIHSILILIGSVLFIWLIENILRSSDGSNRRVLKYPALGSISVGVSLCLAAIYALSTHTITHDILILCSLITLVGVSFLIFFSIRFKLFEMDIFVSRYVVYHSITFISIGSYLLLTGIIILWIQKLGMKLSFVITGFMVFIALIVLSILVLSPEAKARLKFFINTHFFSNKYDYRKEWGELSGYLSIAFNESQIIHLTSQVILDSMYIKELSIWLLKGSDFRRAFSFPDSPGDNAVTSDHPLIGYLKSNPYFMQRTPFQTNDTLWEDITKNRKIFLDRNKIELAVSMMAGNMMIGFITVGQENPGTPYGQDDIDLLTAVASQSSAALMSAWYAQRLAENKELDTYNRMSASILHDLKNAAGHLSLILQNAPKHMGDAEFQKDMLETISEALARIDKVQGKLTAIPGREELVIKKVPVGLFLEKLLTRLKPRLENIRTTVKVDEDMELKTDSDVLENMLENIIVNASEAVGENGKISIRAGRKDGSPFFSVTDNGMGMTAEFIRERLFKPFQTTKKRGTGLGLWLVKNMAEQLGARIEVTQNNDSGVTFTVILVEDRPLTEG
jgi:putative PEP-CTERM system histidine kinase